jgi:HEAT repeat protein
MISHRHGAGRSIIRVTVLWSLGVLAVVSMAAAQSGTLIDQFRSADRLGKMRVLGDALLARVPASEADMRNLLNEAMKDRDGTVRAEAVGTIGTILLFSSMPKPPLGADWTVQWRSVASDLRPYLDTALADPEPRVRREALRGLVAPYAGLGSAPPRPTLPLPVAARLSALFETDDSAIVRSALLPIIASAYTSEDPEVRRLAARSILRGLEETEPSVVQAASRAAGDAKLPEALPLLVKHLKHPSFNVRMVVAQGIAGYRADARRYMRELEAALAAETHDITRKTIAGTISVISREPADAPTPHAAGRSPAPQSTTDTRTR